MANICLAPVFLFFPIHYLDWKKRLEGLSNLLTFIQEHPVEISHPMRVVALFDALLQRCRDSNSKVNMYGMEVLVSSLRYIKVRIIIFLNVIKH